MATATTAVNSNNRPMAPTYEQLKQQLAALEAKLATKSTRTITPKVSAKGAVSVYGLSARYPTALYASQWEALALSQFGFKSLDDFYTNSDLGKFIKANEDKVSRKEDVTQ